jgi:hypothetical protein
MKNRAAAQDSRDRKRAYLDQLEQHNALLQSQNTLLQSRMTQLESQNAALLQKLDQFSLLSSLIPNLDQFLTLTAGYGEPAALPTLLSEEESQQRIRPLLLLLVGRISILAALLVKARRISMDCLTERRKRVGNGLLAFKEERREVGGAAKSRRVGGVQGVKMDKPCGYQALRTARGMRFRHAF